MKNITIEKPKNSFGDIKITEKFVDDRINRILDLFLENKFSIEKVKTEIAEILEAAKQNRVYKYEKATEKESS